MCEHKFVYLGLVYSVGQWSLPGTGAKAVTYYDKYYCEKCLEIRLQNPRELGNSYSPVLSGAIPA